MNPELEKIATSEKILNFDDAIKKIAQLKSNGKTLGLCNGGFDLMHPGHIKHFESAKRFCDYLIVSVTSDKFVINRKGEGRPIFSDKLRAYSIASLEFVDFVVISDYKKGIEVIDQLKPSYYIKGPDYINKTTPGISAEREAIKAIGGEIKYTTEPCLSTTAIINHIKTEVYQKKILVCIDRDGTLISEQEFLGKESNWRDKIVLKEPVVHFLEYLQTKYTTTNIVVSNQSGIARKYFNKNRVEEINKYLNIKLVNNNIKVKNWKYCPDVDSKYAQSQDTEFDQKFIKPTTKRKPSTAMVLDALEEINNQIEDFDEILVIGDRHEDEGLAKNLNAKFINVKNKNYEEMINLFEQIINKIN